jgi:hypothetical protein
MKALVVLLALALLGLAGLVGVQRVAFVNAAVPTSGTVVAIESRNDRCGRRPRRSCTRFTAVVDYTFAGETRQLRASAGSSRGRDEPVTEADYRVGEAFAVRVHPATREALPDSASGLWGLPAVLGIGGGLLAVFGLGGTRRR